jgi:hypothetical protein
MESFPWAPGDYTVPAGASMHECRMGAKRDSALTVVALKLSQGGVGLRCLCQPATADSGWLPQRCVGGWWQSAAAVAGGGGSEQTGLPMGVSRGGGDPSRGPWTGLGLPRRRDRLSCYLWYLGGVSSDRRLHRTAPPAAATLIRGRKPISRNWAVNQSRPKIPRPSTLLLFIVSSPSPSPSPSAVEQLLY